MGYDLHITRRELWHNEGDDITAEEWLAHVQLDPELRLRPENGPFHVEWQVAGSSSWFDWSHGQIYTKYPDPSTIEKMVAIAHQLGATVQGDDGEFYEEGGGSSPIEPAPAAAPPTEPSFGQRMSAWFARLLPRRSLPIVHEPLGFRVGDQVIDVWGNAHTVLIIDPEAEHGAGVIRTRRADGTEHAHTMIAHGLKRP